MRIYALWDSKLGAFMAPFAARNDEDARRQIASALRSPEIQQTPVGTNPSDFELKALADYSDTNGVTNHYAPAHVANCSELAPSTVST